MRRILVAGLGVVGLLFGLAGCSDDTTLPPKPEGPKPGDAGLEARVDKAPGEGTVPDAKGEGQQARQWSALLSLAEVSGRTSWGPPPDPPPPAVKLLSVAATFDSPTATIKPDFADSPNPPNCVGYKWAKGSAPNRSAGDAGKVTITGHATAIYVDGEAQTPNPKPLPATIECNRKEVAAGSGLFIYDCGLPSLTVLPTTASAVTDTTKATFTAAGGADIAAFEVKDISAGPVVKPKASFDLNQINPAAIKAEWETTTAALVAIRISASLKDGSQFADITCTALGSAGSKQIPDGALKLLPTPTDTNPLILRTSLVGFNVGGTVATWGRYTVGVGRGTFGVSCRLASAACPPPPAP